MGDLNRGATFVDGSTIVDAAALHSLVENAKLNSTAITGLTQSSSISVLDQFMIWDESDDALRSVPYSTISSAVIAATTVGNLKKSVNQVAHGFSAGNAIRIASAGTSYVKAQATFPSYAFTTAEVDLVNNRITLPTNTVFNGEQVILSSDTTLPAPLVNYSRYFAKTISAFVVELYTDSGLTSVVDLTDVGSGNHKLYNELERNHAIGIVTSVVDSANFVVTLCGDTTWSTAALTPGKIYFVSPTSAGALQTTPPVLPVHVMQPVLIATTATTGFLFPYVANPIAVDAVRTEHIAPKAVGRTELSAEITQALDRNIGSERQMVISGRKSSATGVADFLEPGAGLQVLARCSTTDPLIISFANGFDDALGYNYVEKVTLDNRPFNSLPASSEVFLYVERTAPGVLAYSYSNKSPEYGYVKSVNRSRNVFPRLYSADSENGFTVLATSAVGGNEARKAFNGERSTYWQPTTTGGGVSLRGIYTYAKVVNSYSIRSAATGTSYPTAWTIEGSNDGFGSSTVLDTQSSQTFGTSELKTYNFTNNTAYLGYRISVTTVNGGVACRIAELAFCEAVDHYYVIPEGKMYNWNGSAWVAVNRVFVGEVRTGASTVVAGTTTLGLFTYAIRGLYVSPQTVFNAGSTAVPLVSAIGTPVVDARVNYRENLSYTYNKSEYGTTGSSTLHPEVGYINAASASATSTLGGDPRLERLYSSIVALDSTITNASSNLTSNGASTTSFADTYMVVRRLF